MSASFFGWPGILLGDGAWRRDCGIGPDDGLIRLLIYYASRCADLRCGGWNKSH